jgi:hypothetical protein
MARRLNPPSARRASEFLDMTGRRGVQRALRFRQRRPPLSVAASGPPTPPWRPSPRRTRPTRRRHQCPAPTT